MYFQLSLPVKQELFSGVHPCLFSALLYTFSLLVFHSSMHFRQVKYLWQILSTFICYRPLNILWGEGRYILIKLSTMHLEMCIIRKLNEYSECTDLKLESKLLVHSNPLYISIINSVHQTYHLPII